MIAIAAQTGGLSSEHVVGERFDALGDLVNQHCTGRYTSALDTLYVMYRVDGELTAFGLDGVSHVRVQLKSRYAKADANISQPTWKSKSGRELDRLLIDLGEDALKAVIKRLSQKRIPFDAEAFWGDWAQVRADFDRPDRKRHDQFHEVAKYVRSRYGIELEEEGEEDDL